MPTATQQRTTVRHGDRLRITLDDGGHCFEIGTIVRIVEYNSTSEYDWLEDEDQAMATILDPLPRNPEHNVGTTAWVKRLETEFVEPEPSDVRECTHGTHPSEPHIHWRGRMAEVLHSPPDYVARTLPRADDHVYAKGEHRVADVTAHVEFSEHNSTPEWPIRECAVIAHISEPHYHVTSTNRHRFDDGSRVVMYAYNVHEQNPYHTEQGVRYAKGEYVPPPSQVVNDEEEWIESPVGRTVVTPEPGQRWRITADNNSHRFPIGTVVRVCNHNRRNHSGVDRGFGPDRVFLATTSDDLDSEWSSLVGEARTRVVRPRDAVPLIRNPNYRPTASEPEPEPEPEVDLLPPEEVSRLIKADPVLSITLFDKATRIDSLMEQITAARAAVDEARAERAEWTERLIVRSHRVSKEQNWCGVFDDGMRKLGLPTRQDRIVRETITARATAYVDFRFPTDKSADDVLARKVDGYDPANVADGYETDWTTNARLVRTYLTVEAEVEVNEGECGCNQLAIRDAMPEWVTNSEHLQAHGLYTNEGCDNCE